MDVAVKAGQDSMPAGLAKVLELLGNSLDVCDPDGTLDVNARELTATNGKAILIATYKNGKGVFDPTAIKVEGAEGKVSDNSVVFELEPNSDHEKTYTVTAGKKTIAIKVNPSKSGDSSSGTSQK